MRGGTLARGARTRGGVGGGGRRLDIAEKGRHALQELVADAITERKSIKKYLVVGYVGTGK